MNRFVLRTIGAWAILGFFVAALSCAHDQQLVSIEVIPTTEDFGGPDPSLGVQLQALGHYIHPPVTKDITDKVVWKSNTPTVADVDATGFLHPGGIDCGNAVISAKVQTNTSTGGRTSAGAIVPGTMIANVACPGGTGSSGSGGSGGNARLTVDFSGTGSGTIVSSPAGLGCSTTCSGTFATGTSVTLTATANTGSTFASWLGCDSGSAQSCTVPMNNDRAVTVTFQ